MKLRYRCDGCKPVIRDTETEDFNAGEYFAGVMARREYGRRGHVGPCRFNSWTEDGMCEEYDAFIGISNRDGMSGHNIRFVVTKDKV